ncbi:MAG: hypothetical protein OS112_05175 [Methanoregula sp.]|nr:MAG: hypothetical protein OS112_05175 [Methanoregula sp.]
MAVKTGKYIHHAVTVTDDPIQCIGGNSICVFGAFGSGKTTLQGILEEQSLHILPPYNRETAYYQWNMAKDDCIKNPVKVIQTTVLRIAREWENYNSLIPGRLSRYWKGRDLKPIYIHMKKNSSFLFSINGASYTPPDKYVKYYTNVSSLIKNLVPGAINVAYPPESHTMSLRLVKELETRRLDPDKLNRKTRGLAILDLYKRYGKYSSPQYWLFDLLTALPREKNIDEPILVSVDEAHNYFPARASGLTWHLIECFSNVLVDYRKNNISFLCSSHSAMYLDYRILGRVQYLYLLKGADVGKNLTMINPGLIAKLSKGEFLVEEVRQQFGSAVFPPIPGRQPLVFCRNYPKLDVIENEGETEEMETTNGEMAYA